MPSGSWSEFLSAILHWVCRQCGYTNGYLKWDKWFKIFQGQAPLSRRIENWAGNKLLQNFSTKNKNRTREEGNVKYAAMIFLFLQNGKPLDKNEIQNDQDINRSFTKLKPSQEFYICWNISANPRDKLVKRWRYHKKFTFVETSRRIQTTNWSKDGAQGCD